MLRFSPAAGFAVAALLLCGTTTTGATDAFVLKADTCDVTISGWSRADVVETRESAARVSVRAPRGRAVDISLRAGRITLANLNGDVRATVEHGSIEARQLSGTVRLETVIGDIRVDDAELRREGLMRLRTFNGNVRLRFATALLDARILALTLSGAIESDIPLNMKAAFGPRFGEATLGRDGALVSIDVVNGDIRIAGGKS